MLCCLMAGGLTALADELRLRNGRVIEADEVWETTDAVWYRQGKVVASVNKADVVQITKQIADEAVKENKGKKSNSNSTNEGVS